ncbi:MAG: hypothetical protein K1X79_08865 [Oligoflexia bacterium]|nr:hypothetical protein [Oligoflexia bacterium]
MILGAGRLLDADVPFLLSVFEQLLLLDADPGALEELKKNRDLRAAGARVQYLLQDVTGSIESWTEELEGLLFNKCEESSLTEFLQQLRPYDSPQVKAQVVLSLNLLGQIPLYWRDRVHALLLDQYGLDTDVDGKYAPALQAALDASCAALQLGHLEMLKSTAAETIMLIFDREYCYYRRDQAPWRVESAMYCSNVEAALAPYQACERDSWLWHIAPQGVEASDHGEIHVVEAHAFRHEK